MRESRYLWDVRQALPISDERLSSLLRAAGLPEPIGREERTAFPGHLVDGVTLPGDRRVLAVSAPGQEETVALRLLLGHPINPQRLLAAEESNFLLEDAPFEPLRDSGSPEDFAALGEAIGALHREFRGGEMNLPVHDAAWFSRAAPYVLAEVATLAEAGEYDLSMTDTGRLEEAGVVIAELSEPLTGLLPTLVHGACDAAHAGFSRGRPALIGWGLANAGLGWTDLACLTDVAARSGQEGMLALIGAYAASAGYEPALVSDLVPFCRVLSDVYRLDRWNRELGAGIRSPGSLREASRRRIHRLLSLIAI